MAGKRIKHDDYFDTRGSRLELFFFWLFLAGFVACTIAVLIVGR